MSRSSIHLTENESEDVHDFTNVDFVLVYDISKDNQKEILQLKRRTFERNLIQTGVKISKSDGVDDHTLCFVKLKIPWNVLLTFADIMKMKMPLKTKMKTPPSTSLESLFSHVPALFAIPGLQEFDRKNEYWSAFRYDKKEIFDIEPNEKFFTKSQKSLIAHEILVRTKYSNHPEDVGIHRLIKCGVYLAAYSLHEGKFKSGRDQSKVKTERQILYEFWVRPRRFYQYQPISLIRKYFGERITIYFSWLGFYTFLLIPVSIIGLIGFLYNVIQFGESDLSKEICNETGMGSLIMCPKCDVNCDYWRLSYSCTFSKISSVFDNVFTMIFAIVMSIWASVFFRLWMRKQTDLQFSWNTNDFEESENQRLEYEMNCQSQRVNPVTDEWEWYMSFSEKLPRKIISFMVVSLMVSLVLIVILGIIMIRIVLTNTFHRLRINILGSYTKVVISSVTSFLDLTTIIILNLIYQNIAISLTDFENPRTETEYENTLTLKMYIFQFFNFYSSLFYIAFIKGSFVGRPGNYNYVFGWRLEECDPCGCMVELSIQMIVIFVGKQIINNIMEISFPFVKGKWFRFLYKYKHRNTSQTVLRRQYTYSNDETENSGNEFPGRTVLKFIPQWEKDFHLIDTVPTDLFDEYLEMVIQYGFVVFFAAVMPLAPLFALLNNIIEIRIDAYKMLTKWKRPLARPAQNIGIWNDILRIISKVAVVTNAFIISCTSQAIPNLVYKYHYHLHYDSSLHGYVNFTLSTFYIKDFNVSVLPRDSLEEFRNISHCRYLGFRDHKIDDNSYPVSIVFWHVLAARLAFVIAFEHTMFYIGLLIEWMFSTVSPSIKFRMEQEKVLNKNLMFQAGTEELSKVLFERSSIRTARSSGRNSDFSLPVFKKA